MAAPAPRLAPVTRAMRSERSGMAVILNEDSQMAGRPRTHSDDALLDATFRAVGRRRPRAADAGRRRPRGRRRAGDARAALRLQARAAGGRGGARPRRARAAALPGARRGAAGRADRRPGRPHRARRATPPPSPTTSRCCSSTSPIPSCARSPSRTPAGCAARSARCSTPPSLAGELEPCDTRALADAVHATFHGAQLDWAVDRRGTLAGRVRRALGRSARARTPRLSSRGAIVGCSCPQCSTSSRRSSSWRSSRRSTSATSSSRAAGWPRSGTPTSRRPGASSSTSAT